jgi:hypothetical protein
LQRTNDDDQYKEHPYHHYYHAPPLSACHGHHSILNERHRWFFLCHNINISALMQSKAILLAILLCTL